MPKRRAKNNEDINEAAHRVVAEATGEITVPIVTKPAIKSPEKNPAAVALGRLGGAKGGRARAAKLTAERRSEIARKAAAKRWGAQRPEDIAPRTRDKH